MRTIDYFDVTTWEAVYTGLTDIKGVSFPLLEDNPSRNVEFHVNSLYPMDLIICRKSDEQKPGPSKYKIPNRDGVIVYYEYVADMARLEGMAMVKFTAPFDSAVIFKPHHDGYTGVDDPRHGNRYNIEYRLQDQDQTVDLVDEDGYTTIEPGGRPAPDYQRLLLQAQYNQQLRDQQYMEELAQLRDEFGNRPNVEPPDNPSIDAGDEA